jgi:catechol 2,3-dioxygenase-like lactoylglutathione lyase family enzyme
LFLHFELPSDLVSLRSLLFKILIRKASGPGSSAQHPFKNFNGESTMGVESATKPSSNPLVAPAWTSVTVGVANLDEALALWRDTFDLEVRSLREGADVDLSHLWGLQENDIQRQALVAAHGVATGMIHLVQFTHPGPAVREGAQAFDEVPKNLDIYVQDMPSRVDALRKAGYRFRNEHYSEVTAPDGTQFREIHLPSHDDINVVLLEVIGLDMPFNPAGFSGVGPLITIVSNAAAERAFFMNIMGLSMLSENLLDGPEIEKMVGLPPGSALDVSIWGEKDAPFGQVEIIDYRGVQGKDLYSLTVPPNRGILHLKYQVSDLDAFSALLQKAGISHTHPVDVDVLPDKGRHLRFRSPGGLNLEAFQAE